MAEKKYKCIILFISIETRPFSTPQIVRNLLMKGYLLSFIFFFKFTRIPHEEHSVLSEMEYFSLSGLTGS